MPALTVHNRPLAPLTLAVRDAAHLAALNAAEIVAAEIRARVPIDEGDLLSTVRAVGRSTTARADAIVGNARVPYGADVEFGHQTPRRRHRKRNATQPSTPPAVAPRPFMRQTAAHIRDTATRAALDHLSATLAAAVQRLK